MMLSWPLGTFGYRASSVLVGTVVFLVLIGILWIKLRRKGPETVVGVWIAFTLLFVSATAIGRVCLGLIQSQSSRYMPYLMPGLFGIYLFVRGIRRQPVRRMATAVLVAALLVAEWRYGDLRTPGIERIAHRKAIWARCYVQQKSVRRCDREARIQIHPDPRKTHLELKLRYLETHRLNLFKSAPTGG